MCSSSKINTILKTAITIDIAIFTGVRDQAYCVEEMNSKFTANYRMASIQIAIILHRLPILSLTCAGMRFISQLYLTFSKRKKNRKGNCRHHV